ncbi:hypothetical protein ISF_00827 [Cordyceps fumosorosea ARSEF 2679]|uniref:Fungal specific transcription factor n=1 Tax=Cordyceps fumosorosea (strain ARSEF 2679) TaxID=1081104 RepID=A0A168EKL1_CORFA|nr:hypothetical protein ISF_00827 [Cordyceps fumosorosea ARSEF 2679]OAA73926.1 hypothetical protein ISF_00827 [Cordyceps fumosorosea ARSEF 2679]
MASSVQAGYFPVYPVQDLLPDPEIRTFLTNFYRISDNPASDELWVSHFTDDAHIRELRGRMWKVVAERRHTVEKVFPARFREDEQGECECMLFGEVRIKTRDDKEMVVPWAGHATLTKVVVDGLKEEWKFAQYRVWLQR